MSALLGKIIAFFVCWIETALIFAVNLVLSALGLLVAAIVFILPPMPNMPEVPSIVSTAISWASYIFPLSFIFTLILTLGALWLAWMMLAIPLRWAKAIRGGA